MLAWRRQVAGDVIVRRATLAPTDIDRMDVYLVPANSTRFALYCEGHAPVDAADDGDMSRLAEMKRTFRRAVDEGEKAEDGEADQAERGRLRRFITRKLAEAVAEQRLLWRIRHESRVRLFHPDTVAAERALGLARSECERDYLRHRRWLVVNAVLVAMTGPLFFFVPGPNLISWYFTFRAVGHFFSMRGARRAVRVVTWTAEATPHLTTVASALALDADARAERLAAAGEALGLRRLAAFAERIRDRSA